MDEFHKKKNSFLVMTVKLPQVIMRTKVLMSEKTMSVCKG